MAENNKKYVVDGFSFSSRSDYDKALKEKEAIAYIVANTNMADMKSVLKIYNMSVEKKSFTTIIGLEFVNNMRKNLISSGIVPKNTLMDIPVPKISSSKVTNTDNSIINAKTDRYKQAYENALAGKTIKNIVIVFLTLIIVAMLVITFKSKYSVFTYFTDYKADMENELVDKYETWKNELDEREKELNKREKALKDR